MGKKVLIVGAGPAGLTAAYELLKNSNIHPIIIEKEDFVGGISRTVNHNGNRIDIGGHRFFSKNEEIMKLWQTLMPLQGKDSIDDIILKKNKPLVKNGPDPEIEDRVMLIRSRVSRILYLRKFFDYPISLKLQTIGNLGFFNTFRAGITYASAQVFKRDEITLEDFMRNRFGTSLYRMFFKDYTKKVWGKDPAEISADWGAQRIKGLSLSKALFYILKKPFRKKDLMQNNIETSLIELFSYPKRGPGQLWECMAENIISCGGEIIQNTEVSQINIYENRVHSVVIDSSSGKQVIEVDYCISSMAICDLIASLSCPIPNDVKEIAANLPYRDFITVGLLVNKLSIANTTKIKTINNRVPDCWIYVQEPDVKVGRIQFFNNWSPYMVKDFENTMWIGLEYFCDENDELWNQTDDEFIEFARTEAIKLGLIPDEEVLDSIRIKIQKAYPAYFGTYKDFEKVRTFVDDIENLYCVGRNGQHRYNNMDHSMLTALEASRLIIKGNKDKSTVWSINTESKYHEVKRNDEGVGAQCQTN